MLFEISIINYGMIKDNRRDLIIANRKPILRNLKIRVFFIKTFFLILKEVLREGVVRYDIQVDTSQKTIFKYDFWLVIVRGKAKLWSSFKGIKNLETRVI